MKSFKENIVVLSMKGPFCLVINKGQDYEENVEIGKSKVVSKISTEKDFKIIGRFSTPDAGIILERLRKVNGPI